MKEYQNKIKLIDFIHQLLNISNQISRKYFRNDNNEEIKQDKSPVTIADCIIEEKWRELIIKSFPHHGIIGEEFDNYQENADFQWILDPIDGTSSFIIGRPIFGNLIALTYKKQVICGIINQPINNELWIAFAPYQAEIYGNITHYQTSPDQQKWGKKLIKEFGNIDISNINFGSFFNGKKIATRNYQNIANSVISSSSCHYFNKLQQKNILDKIRLNSKYQKIGGIIYGGDCYSYGSLACGWLDIVIDPAMKIYDYAALIPIITMAGGFISDWQGNNLIIDHNIETKDIIACINYKLADEILNLIK